MSRLYQSNLWAYLNTHILSKACLRHMIYSSHIGTMFPTISRQLMWIQNKRLPYVRIPKQNPPFYRNSHMQSLWPLVPPPSPDAEASRAARTSWWPVALSWAAGFLGLIRGHAQEILGSLTEAPGPTSSFTKTWKAK